MLRGERAIARRADHEAQQERISEAVWTTLAGKGIEHLTIRAVAAAAGCTTGLVMHRFPGRKALLAHARDLLHERTRDRVERLEAEAATPRDALRAILAQGMALDEESAQEALVWTGFLAASVGDDELIALHRRNNRAWRDRVSRLVAASAPDWGSARVATAVFALMSVAEGAAQLACFDPETYSPAAQEAALDQMLEALGLGPALHPRESAEPSLRFPPPGEVPTGTAWRRGFLSDPAARLGLPSLPLSGGWGLGTAVPKRPKVRCD